VSSEPQLILSYYTDTDVVLGAMSKSLATIATQPLIVAKVGLQSRPPPARNGVPFKTFGEVMSFIVEHEGWLGLFKGIAPQISKGIIVQGLLMMTKERYVRVVLPWNSITNSPLRVELMFILLFRSIRQMRTDKLQKLANLAAEKAGKAAPVLLK
jgi:Mitochondrial carrier protein